jgi:monoamine oxidase
MFKPEPRKHSRRRFLGNVSLLAASALFPLPAFPGSGRVLVVGAGLSGLYAATLLEKQGVEVKVIEARRRVGGRIFTLDDVPGRPEGGGNTIGPNYGRFIHQARRLAVPLENPSRGEASGLLINGRRIATESWADSPLNPLPGPYRSVSPARLRSALLKDNPLKSSVAWRNPEMAVHDRSAGEYFRSLGLNDEALQLLDVNNSYGNRLQDTSLLNLYRVGASISRGMAMRQPVWQVKGGNMRLPEAMASALVSPPVLGEQVLEIEQSASEVEVRCESGREYRADFLICALPATAVRKIRFSPSMPESQHQAFTEVEYHKVTQAHLVAERPFWEDAGDSGSLWTNGVLGRVFTRAMGDGSGRYNMTVWINGDGCDLFDAMSPEQASRAIVAELERISPAAKGALKQGGLVRWAIDPLNEGAWAVWRPGQIARLPKLMQQAHGRSHFAGEHLAISNSGMEGAMESGERAALEVLRKLA